MRKKSFFILLISIIAFSGIALAVNAQGFLDSLVNPLTRFDSVYAKFSFFIDAIIYLMIFLGLSQFAFKKKFGKEGKAVTVGVGLVLALSLALFGARTGFNIGSFGPVAAIMLLALMGYAVWAGVTSLEIEGVDKITVSAVAFMLVYFGVLMAVPGAAVWINERVPIIGALLALMALGFTVFLIYKMGTFIGSLFGSGGGDGTGGTPSTPTTPHTPTPDTPTPPGGRGRVAGPTPQQVKDAQRQSHFAEQGQKFAIMLKGMCAEVLNAITEAGKVLRAGDENLDATKKKFQNAIKEINKKETPLGRYLRRAGHRAHTLHAAREVGSPTIENLEKLATSLTTRGEQHLDEVQKLIGELRNETKRVSEQEDFERVSNVLRRLHNEQTEICGIINELANAFALCHELLDDLSVAAHK